MNKNELPENLKDAMARYRDVWFEKASDKEISKIGDEINVLQSRLNVLCLPYDEEMNELEEYIKAQVFEIGNSVEYAGVKANHTSGHERITWNNNKMSSILLSNPNLAPIFTPARKVTKIKPRVKIKYVGEPEEKDSVAYSREDYEASKELNDGAE